MFSASTLLLLMKKNPTDNTKNPHSNQNPPCDKNPAPPDLLPPRPETYTIAEAAKVLNCSTRHVARMLEDKEIPQYMDLRRADSPRQMIRVPRQALLEYMKKRLN
jgi:excisionase family DNA binding protein